jgi:hypothetical protein
MADDTGPVVNYSMEDLGLSPAYVKRTLEDLAQDQMRTEADVAKVSRMVMLAGGVGLVAVGIGVLNMKINKALMGNLQQIGGAVLTTQEYVGMHQANTPYNPAVDARPMPVSTEPVREDPSEGLYDPGPQEPPDHVKQALLDEPVAGLLDEEGPDH